MRTGSDPLQPFPSLASSLNMHILAPSEFGPKYPSKPRLFLCQIPPSLINDIPYYLINKIDDCFTILWKVQQSLRSTYHLRGLLVKVMTVSVECASEELELEEFSQGILVHAIHSFV